MSGLAIRVDPAGLSGDGVAVAAPTVTPAATVAAPPGLDPTSAGGTAVVSAHNTVLELLFAHAKAIQVSGGQSVTSAATSFVGTDDASAALFGGAPAALPAVASVAVPSAPTLPTIPSVAPTAPLLPEVQSAALHGGPGAQGLRDFATQIRATSGQAGSVSSDLSSAGVGIDSHWFDDGLQRAGANTTRLGGWFQSASQRAATIAGAADEIADAFDRCVADTPTPQQFSAVDTDIRTAAAAGDLVGFVNGVNRRTTMNAQTVDAATGYQQTVTTVSTRLDVPLEPPPPINDDDGVQMLDETTGDGRKIWTGQEIADRLKQLRQGNKRGVREVDTEAELWALWDQFRQGGTVVDSPTDKIYEQVRLPDGTTVNMRQSDQSGLSLGVGYPPGVTGDHTVHVPNHPDATPTPRPPSLPTPTPTPSISTTPTPTPTPSPVPMPEPAPVGAPDLSVPEPDPSVGAIIGGFFVGVGAFLYWLSDPFGATP